MRDRFGELRGVAALLLAAILLIVAGPASAQAPAAYDPAAYNKVFFETFTSRCMPAAHSGSTYDTSGMTRMVDFMAEHWLGGSPGSVWTPDPALEIVLIIRDKVGCAVVSVAGDAGAIEAAVAARFDGPSSAFERDHFERADDGGFESRYGDDCGQGQRCRVTFNVRGAPEAGRIAMMAAATRGEP